MAGSPSAVTADQFLGPSPKPTAEEFFSLPAKPTAAEFFSSSAPRAQDFLGPSPTPTPTIYEFLGSGAKPTAETFFGLPSRAPAKVGPRAVAIQSARNLKADYGTRRRAAQDLMAEGSKEYGAPTGPLSSISGMAKMAGGAFSYLASPVAGAVQSLVGRPLETITGGRLPKEMMGDYTEAMAGFMVPGAPKAAKGRPAAGVEYKAFKPTGTVEPVSSVDEFLAGGAKPSADDFFAEASMAPGNPARVRPTANEFFDAERVPTMAAKVEDPYDEILMPRRRPKAAASPVAVQPLQKQGVKEGAIDAANAVQKIMAPATIGLGVDAARTIRRASSEADLLAAQAAQTLLEHTRTVAELPVPEQRALVAYIEGRSLGVKLPDPALRKTADDIRKVNDTYRGRIEQLMSTDGSDGPSFISDYYTHMWKDAPDTVRYRMVRSMQGSDRNLKRRSIPTLQDGIDAGLTPVTENPIEATLNYANNMSRYLATVDTQQELMAAGMAKMLPINQHPDGWIPLNGIRATKPGHVVIEDDVTVANHPPQRLYAPADVARVYNNWISKGLEAGDIGPLFSGARKVSNGMTMLKLGLSAFHAVTMTNEAMVSELARGIKAVSRGDLATGAAAIGKSPGAFIGRAARGDRMRGELLGKLEPPDGLSEAVNNAFVRAGGRVRMDSLYRVRGAGSFYNALHSGTWKSELKATGEAIYGRDRLMVQRAGGVLDLGANLIQSFAAPLFESYIPRLKQGAFASTMEDWLSTNPGATQRAIDDAAHLINRSIDNRFGEMAWDNLFWHRWMKQASQILLLSPSWNIGTINEIGGGLLDALGPSAKGLIKGEGITDRTAYVAALAAQVALLNGVITYLKTGTAPEGKDFMVYRTGGVDASSGEPERALVPGYQKDVYAFGYDFPHHIGQEVANKLNPALKTAIELSTNKDFRGLPIQPGGGAVQAGNDRGLGDYLLEAFMPISVGQLRKGNKQGSNLTVAERAAAIRPAPAYLTAPERVGQMKERQARREWNRKRRADHRDAVLRGKPD